MKHRLAIVVLYKEFEALGLVEAVLVTVDFSTFK
jgi:hypothetical protein